LAQPTLTLLILADRGDRLAALLAHHGRLWDEAVVVDTGDGGAGAVAASAGARAVPHAWNDDFAAARNAGVAAATGDWILILDTDELVAPRDLDRLREAVTAEPFVGLQTVVNYCADARHPEWRPLRGEYPAEEAGQRGCFLSRRAGLFPRRPGLVFEGCVHETILPAALAQGLPARPLRVPVHHYGFTLGGQHNAARRARYASLVRRKHAQRPDDTAAAVELASVLLEEGKPGEARSLLEALADRRPVDSAITRGRFLLGRLLREEGRLTIARTLLARAVAEDPRHEFCWLELIRVVAAAGAWGDCDRLIGEARRRFGDDPLLDKEELRCLVKTGRLEAAALVLARLRQIYPGWDDLADLSRRLPSPGRSLPGGPVA